MSKGSNIRPRKVPRETYEVNWDRIFGEWKDSPLLGVKKSDTMTNNKRSGNGKRRHTV